MSWVVLVNPAAGRRAVDPNRIRHVLREAGVVGDVEVALGRPAMREAIAEVARSSRDLAVVGGDGTLGLAVDTLMTEGLRVPRLALLPGGTGCDLLRTFGMPRDLEGAARRLRTEDTYQIDVGRIEGSWGARYFVNVAQTGAGAAAAESAPRIPRWMGSIRYPAAFVARLPAFPHAEVIIESDRIDERRALAVILANGQFFAGGWNVAPRALLADGQLDVQVISARKIQAPGLVPRIIRGTHLSHATVRRRSLTSVSIVTDVEWPVEADGDYLGRTPFHASVVPGAITLKI